MSPISKHLFRIAIGLLASLCLLISFGGLIILSFPSSPAPLLWAFFLLFLVWIILVCWVIFVGYEEDPRREEGERKTSPSKEIENEI